MCTKNRLPEAKDEFDRVADRQAILDSVDLFLIKITSNSSNIVRCMPLCDMLLDFVLCSVYIMLKKNDT